MEGDITKITEELTKSLAKIAKISALYKEVLAGRCFVCENVILGMRNSF